MKRVVIEMDEPERKGNTKVKIPKCWICRDLGFIMYQKKEFGILYDTAISCVCREGQKNWGGMARISDDMAVVVAEDNFKKWAEYFPEEAKEVLKNGVKV